MAATVTHVPHRSPANVDKAPEAPDGRRIAHAVAKSDSLELVTRRELLALFTEMVGDSPEDERWALTRKGGAA